jgi:flagellar L-ring protein precursor FlgH
MTASRILLWIVICAALPACAGAPHIGAFTPRQRVYGPGSYAQSQPSARPSPGSLFSDAEPGFLEDTRAVRVGDALVVHINETPNAQGSATTDLSHNSTGNSGMTGLLGLVPVLKRAYPALDPSTLFSYASQTTYNGAGDTARSGQLAGDIAVRVVREMPNGDLFLEGTKVLLINNEEYHLYVSGLVRPTDIAQDNSIVSSRIADAQIEFTGRGDVSEQQRKGWLARILDTINPF